MNSEGLIIAIYTQNSGKVRNGREQIHTCVRRYMYQQHHDLVRRDMYQNVRGKKDALETN